MSAAGGRAPARAPRHAALYARPFLYLAILIVLLSAGRVALWAAYPSHFADLGGAETLSAFARGLRFDLSTACWMLGLPVWLLLWPARFARGRTWQAIWGWMTCTLILLALFVVAADIVYFSLAHRHIGHDLAVGAAGNWTALARSALGYPVTLSVTLATGAALVALWRRWLRFPAPPLRRRSLAWLLAIAWLPAIVIGARGGLQEMPIALVDAFRGRSLDAGYLSLNGPFSVMYSSGDTRRRSQAAVRAAERTALARFTSSAREAWRGPSYPLQRRALGSAADGRAAEAPPRLEGVVGDATARPHSRRHPHVVVLVFEGLDVWTLDAYRRSAGLPALGVTPNLDRLAREGLLFTRLLGHGQLSIEGLGALLASFPSIPGLPTFGQGLEQTRMLYLGSAARSQGYDTYFVRSAHRESFRLESTAALAGFDLYAGREDIAAAGPSHAGRPYGIWGAWDLDTLRFLHERLRASPGPALGVFFGSSSHPPYQLPGERWAVFPGADERSRYLNAVHYVDWALGEFMGLAEEAGYADETLWVITSDQASRLGRSDLAPERFAVPTLFVGPGIPRDSVDTRLASQLDILPTILDGTGWPVAHASFGESLLRDREPAALVKVGELLLRADSAAWILHSLEERVTGGGPESEQDRLERLLLAEVQMLERLVLENRVFEPEAGRP